MEKKGGFPVDRGWAWVVLTACTLETFVIFGVIKAFGILFVAFVEDYNASAATVSLVLSVRTFFFSISSPITMIIGLMYVPSRLLIFIGAAIQCVAFILTAYIPGIEMLFLTLGIMWGVAEALIHGPILVLLGKYFEKRRGLANTLANTGSSLGGLSFSPLFRFLLDEYGLQGTLLIISGILAQIFIVCLVLRPASFYAKNSKTTEVVLSSVNCDAEKCGNLEWTEISKTTSNSIEIEIFKNQHSDGDITKEENTYVPEENDEKNKQMYSKLTAKDLGHEQFEINPRTLHNRKTEITSMHSTLSINSLVVTGSVRSFGAGDLAGEDRMDTKNLKCMNLIRMVFSNLIDKELLSSKLFVLFSLSSFVGSFGCGMILVYMPPFAKDLGIDVSRIPLLVTIYSALDIVGRACLAIFADSGILKRHHILSIAFISTGVLCHLCPFYKEFWSMAIFAAITGFFGGVFFCLFPVILVDFIGMQKLPNALGFNLLAHGISYTIFIPILGVIRDKTQSYIGSYHLMGAAQIIAGLLLLLEPLARK